MQPCLRPGNAEVDTGVFFERVEQLGFPECRNDRVRTAFEEAFEPVSVRAEFKIPVLLRNLDNLPPFWTERPRRVAIPFLEELLLPHGIGAGVRLLVELVPFLEVREDRADASLVAQVDGLRPAVVADAEFLPQRGEASGRAPDEFCRRNALLFGGLLDFLAVLVNAGQEINLIPAKPPVACDHVGEDLFVSMPEVRRAVRVIDGGGDVKHGQGGRGRENMARPGRARTQPPLLRLLAELLQSG